ncbi:MAG: flagellar filament capping protein FliD [Bacteriovoracaceae bacterium]|nr:flagellar filament capping protein FliD [Bacteriovoracaceae bacterium]
MGISFGSINTGLPKDIVKQIMDAEKFPIRQMETRKGKIDEKNKLVVELTKLVEELRTTVSNNKDARDLRELKVITNNDIIDITLDKNKARPGIYQFEVGKLSQKSSAMTSGVEDKDDTYLGVGFVRYNLPNGESREVYVDADHSSLTGIANLINSNDRLGVGATVVNDGSGTDAPWRIILSLKDTGDENLAEFPYFYFIDGEEDIYLEFERGAHDSQVKLDGFEIESQENQINDLIPGTTIDLKKASPGEEFSIKIAEDREAIVAKIEDVIGKINAVLTFIKQQNTLDEKTDTSRTLGGDNLLQSLEMRLRGVIFRPVRTDLGNRRISDVGISFQRDGLLKFDKKQFDAFLAKNYGTISQIFTGSYDENRVKQPGFMNILHRMANESLRMPNGLLPLRKKTFQGRIDQIDRRIQDKQRLLDQKEKNLKDKFARLESTISRIRNQGAGLAGLGGGAALDPVKQLG